MHVASRTETGHVRRRNEDSLLVETATGVFAVADGLGGHPAGDLASQTAVAGLRSALLGNRPQPDDTGDWLAAALFEAHQAVAAEASKDPERFGMATTAVVAAVDGRRVWLAHVGDSRAYLGAEGRLQPLTRDHGMGGYITQALGLDRDISPDVRHLDLTTGDRLLLCTDGLTNMVDDPAIGELLVAGDVTAACDALVETALDNGGIDNVTVIVMEV